MISGVTRGFSAFACGPSVVLQDGVLLLQKQRVYFLKLESYHFLLSFLFLELQIVSFYSPVLVLRFYHVMLVLLAQ